MAKSRSIALYTLGCKLNYSESSAIRRTFEESGYSQAEFSDAADVYVINTCSVTENADKKCRKVVREALKANKDATIAVIGCYAQLKPEEISNIPGVDLVLGASEKFNLPTHIEQYWKDGSKKVLNSPIDEVEKFHHAHSYGDRTRSFLKVQDGCDYSCTFCTIPLARGASRSPSVEEVINQVAKICSTEVKEIVLTGVNIGDFGAKGKEKFVDLVQAIDSSQYQSRFRISSIEPNLLSNEIIDKVAGSSKFMPHFHIPLQSGNNEILGKMRRRYKRELYADRVAHIKNRMPHACIGVDVIVGFPGETREQFLDTYDFLNSLDISYLHVFSYSERDNTIAAQMEGQLPGSAKSERSKMLHILSEKKRRAFYEEHLKTYRTVLFEQAEKENKMFGFTDNYIKVEVDYDPLYCNEEVKVYLSTINENGNVSATIVEESLQHS